MSGSESVRRLGCEQDIPALGRQDFGMGISRGLVQPAFHKPIGSPCGDQGEHAASMRSLVRSVKPVPCN